MWKKFLAASAVASGIIGLLGGGSAFAKDAPFIGEGSYASGQTISPWVSDFDVCVDKSGGYSGGLIAADIWGTNYSTQVVFDGFTENRSCVSVSNTPSNRKMKFVTPMGLSNMGYVAIYEDDLSGGMVILDLDDAAMSNKYLRSYGQSGTRTGKSSATIDFDANGGTGTVPVIAGATIGSSVTLPKNTLTRTGYRFAGWNTKIDGTGTSYADEATITIEEPGQIQLFAQWNPKAVLDGGYYVNQKLKKLADPENADRLNINSEDSKIKTIKIADSLPDGFDTNNSDNIISNTPSWSPMPIYAWFDDADTDGDGIGDGVIYIYSDAEVINASISFGYLFHRMTAVNDVSVLAELDISMVEDVNYLFNGATSLTDISPLASWDTSHMVNMDHMFSGTTSLTDISPLASWNTSNVGNISYMFDGASSLTDISALSSWDTSKVQNMKWVFHGASSLSNISALSSWNTSSVTSASAMFAGTKIANVNALETKQYAGNDYMSWDTSSMTDMSYMFDNCALLSDISALSSWNTSNVKNMSHIFYMYDQNSSLLSDISALSSWNTSNVTDMSYMLGNTKITNVNALETKRYAGKDYVSWDTSNVLDMSWVFFADKYLTDISVLSSWNTSSVTKMDCMFYNASSLSNVSALSSWNTSNVEDMSYMFNGADSLTDVSALAGWDVSSVTDMSYMFSNVPARPLPSWYHE